MKILLALLSLILFPLFAMGSQEGVGDTVLFQELRSDLEFDKTKNRFVLRDWDIPTDTNRDFSPQRDNRGVWLAAVKYIGYFLMALAVLVLIYYIVVGLKNRPKRPPPIEESELDDIERIEEIDLHSHFERAIQDQNYRLALRIRFLTVLQLLTQKKWVEYKSHKTNRNYLLELGGNPLLQPFKKLVNIFEYSWYGLSELNKEQFEACDPSFTQLIVQLESDGRQEDNHRTSRKEILE